MGSQASLSLVKTTASAIVVSHDDQAATDFAAMDTNGDGVVSREEFVAAKLKEAAENEGAQAEAAAAAAAAAQATVEETAEGEGGEGGASFATEEWLQGWKSRLPLECIQRLLSALGPKIESMCEEDPNVGEASLLEVITTSTMVGLLPVPHQILVRKYVQNKNMNKWFTAYIWGTIYMHNQVPPIFDSERIVLFTIFYGQKSGSQPTQGSGVKELDSAQVEEPAAAAEEPEPVVEEPVADAEPAAHADAAP